MQDPFLATFIYVSPHRSLRQDLWKHLVDLSCSINMSWVVLGDFNATPTFADRHGCSSSSLGIGFQDMVVVCGLHDLDFSRPHFTWYRGNRSVRLDRCFGNAKWFEKFPRSLLHHLTRMKSDHRPILLASDEHIPSIRVHSFRYLAGWTLHRDFSSFVRNNWNSSLPISEAVHNFTTAATVWNSEELEGLFEQEKLLWKQKSRIDWVNFSDRTTSFFHSKAKARTRKKVVQSLKLSDMDWCSNHDQLRDAATVFFTTLFDIEAGTPPLLLLRGLFPPIPANAHDSLVGLPVELEIKEALFEMWL
ncbi:hypothetical protein V6N13_048040 [Hibiscus sabdariffa]